MRVSTLCFWERKLTIFSDRYGDLLYRYEQVTDKKEKNVAPLILSLILMLSLFPGPVCQAGEDLTFEASIRIRSEFQNNFNQKYYGGNPPRGSGDDGFLLVRMRFGFDYRPFEEFHISLKVQDSEVWDIALPDSAFYNKTFDTQHNPNKDRWELWDSYVEVKDLFDIPLTLRGGRQRIFYGDKRVFGPGEWGNTGRWIWDAAKVSWVGGEHGIDLFYGRTLLHEPDRFSLNHRHGFESIGICSHFTLPEKFLGLALEPFVMTKRDSHDRYKGENNSVADLDSYYFGVRNVLKDFRGFEYDVTFILQRGDYAQDSIRAYGYHLLLGYTWKKAPSMPRLSIEYSFASGDNDPFDGDRETFDGAFGARDQMYGRMNLFQWQNLRDAQINLELKPKKWICLKAELHQFWLAEKKDAWYLNPHEYRDKTGQSGDNVGIEFDIVARCDLPKGSQIQFGFGHFWPQEFAKKSASQKQANWLFLQWMYECSSKVF